jgi:hypothetical protein
MTRKKDASDMISHAIRKKMALSEVTTMSMLRMNVL